jgi:hypothetical protein
MLRFTLVQSKFSPRRHRGHGEMTRGFFGLMGRAHQTKTLIPLAALSRKRSGSGKRN